MPRPSRPWLRLHSEIIENRKAQKLKPALFKHWINLLCLANINQPRGRLPSIARIAFAFRPMTENAVGKVVEELVALGFIDVQGDELVMHEWDDWQKDSDLNLSPGRAGRNAVRTPLERGKNAVRTHRVEEDIERDKDKEVEVEEEETPAARRNIFVLYDRYMGVPSVTPMIAPALKAAEEEYDPDCIAHCFEEAARASDGRRSWNYVLAILKRHAKEGCHARPRANNGSGQASRSVAADPAELAQIARLGLNREPEFVLDP